VNLDENPLGSVLEAFLEGICLAGLDEGKHLACARACACGCVV
jgi:hypothetical protein